MNLRSLPFKHMAEDRRTIEKWRWGLAAVYGAILLLLVLLIVAAPYTKTETADSSIYPGVSSAATSATR